MIKNIILLSALCWVCVSHAKHPIVRDSMGDTESFKVEKGAPEQEAQRSVAGERIKKKSVKKDGEKFEPTTESDSEVRYWQYQE